MRLSANMLSFRRPVVRSSESPDPRTGTAGLSPRALALWTLAFLLIGAGLRLERYALRFPIWGDEAFLALNFTDRGFWDMTKTLDNVQVAPILFLWAEWSMYHTLGGSELSMRLVPMLAGLGGLYLMGRLARKLLSPLGAFFAVAIFAIGSWPVTMSANLKPYSCDLFFALALITLAVEYLSTRRVSTLVGLTLLAPIAVGFSYPSVFVGGAVSLALLPSVWKAGWLARGVYAAYNVALVGAFGAVMLFIGKEQVGVDPTQTSGTVGQFMRDYWANGFLPDQVWKWPGWLLLRLTGRMMAYPYGDGDGGSTVTFLFFVVGVVAWYRAGPKPVLALMLLPFALNLFAAVIEKFPFGGCCRLSQHLAGPVCLLAGAGLAHATERIHRTVERRRFWTHVALVTFLGCSAVTFVFQIAKPYRDLDARWCKAIDCELDRNAKPGDRLMVVNSARELTAIMQYQIKSGSIPVTFNGELDCENVTGQVWVLEWYNHVRPSDYPRRGPSLVAAQLPSYELIAEATFAYSDMWTDRIHCELRCYAPRGSVPPNKAPMIRTMPW